MRYVKNVILSFVDSVIMAVLPGVCNFLVLVVRSTVRGGGGRSQVSGTIRLYVQ